MRYTPPPTDDRSGGQRGRQRSGLRCRQCGTVHLGGFEFCVQCGARVQGRRFWPPAPEPLQYRKVGARCSACRVSLHEVIESYRVSDDGALDEDEETFICGTLAMWHDAQHRHDATHECRQCGRRFWLVRSWWEGVRRRIAWRVMALVRLR